MEMVKDTPFMYNNGYGVVHTQAYETNMCTPPPTTNSNHDIELQPDNTTFESYLARYPNKGSLNYPFAEYDMLNASLIKVGYAPLDTVGTDAKETPLYYSTEAGLVHWIHLTSYTDFWPGSNQYNWLINDLQYVDRNFTPWHVCVLL